MHAMALLLQYVVFLVFINGLVQCQEISLAKDAYIYNRLEPVREVITSISFHFKTIEATGMLVHLFGSGTTHYLTLELVHGKLRYAGFYGDDIKNVREPAESLHQMYVDRDLADNEWHHVEFLKDTNEISISVDKMGDQRQRRFAYMKIPMGAGIDFRYDEAFVGGLRTFERVSEKQSVSRENMATCMRAAVLNKKTLLNGQRVNAILNYCPTIQYSPVHFTAAASHLMIPAYNSSSIKMAMRFRTVVNSQVIMNHTSNTGARFELAVTRSGKISLAITSNEKEMRMESWRRNYNDGKWHHVEYSIPKEKPLIVKLNVDNNLRKSELPQGLRMDGNLVLGFGYTGCLRDVKLNDVDVNVKKLRRSGAIAFDDCKLRDFCTPDPCQNGGRCNQTDMTFFCGCRRTDFFGTACEKPRTNYTCADIFSRGDNRSDTYFIDLDGMGPMPTLKVFCRMGKLAEQAITQINHTLGRQGLFGLAVKPSATGFSSVAVPYLADEETIRELIMHSQTCRQSMKYRCKRSSLFSNWRNPGSIVVADNKQARWIGEDNLVHYYWPGSKGRRGYCACGMDDSETACVDPRYHCNCDARGPTEQEDGGFFTTKEHLPIRKMEFFDVKEGAGSTGTLTVGHFQCQGLGGSDIMMTFRERFSYVELTPMDEDGLVDAGQIGIEFKTVFNDGVLMYSRGPVSRDYIQIEIVSPNRLRLSINIGADMEYRDINLELDVSQIGMRLNDNQWHNTSVTFNRKDITFGVHNISKRMSFWYRDGVSNLNIDNSPVYVGADPARLDKGFVGCVRNVYIMGRLQDLKNQATYQEDTGVYDGCGSACRLVTNPCNHGYCIEKYTNYTCNCTVSPMEGNHCHSAPYSRSFTTTSKITYEFQGITKPNVTELVVTFGFKTTAVDNMFFQLIGEDKRYLVGSMRKGNINVYLELLGESRVQSSDVAVILAPFPNAFTNGSRHVLRVKWTPGQLTVEMADMPSVKPVTKAIVSSAKVFMGLKQIAVGAAFLPVGSLPADVPRTFDGCSSGMKVLYYPSVNGTQGLLNVYQELSQNPSSFAEASAVEQTCGADLYQAEQLPTLIPPDNYASYTTVRPKYGNEIPFGNNKPIIVAVAGGIAIILVILVILILSYVHRKYVYLKGADEKVQLMNAEQENEPREVRAPLPAATSSRAFPPVDPARKPAPLPVTSSSAGKKSDNFFI